MMPNGHSIASTEPMTLGASVADHGQCGGGQIAEDARVIRPPVAEADEREPDAMARHH